MTGVKNVFIVKMDDKNNIRQRRTGHRTDYRTGRPVDSNTGRNIGRNNDRRIDRIVDLRINNKVQKYFGILVLLILVLFFAVCINIVVTAMKPACNCRIPYQYPL